MNAETVSQMIEQKGEDVTIRKTTAGAYDPSTRTYASATLDYDTKAALVPFERHHLQDASIKVGDIQAWIDAVPLEAIGIEVQSRDMIQRGATNYQIVSLTRHAVGGSLVVYEAHARGAE